MVSCGWPPSPAPGEPRGGGRCSLWPRAPGWVLGGLSCGSGLACSQGPGHPFCSMPGSPQSCGSQRPELTAA